MARVNWRFSLLACVLILVNVAGLVWIHRVVTRAPKPTVRVLAALPMDTADRADRFTLVFDRRVVPPRSVGKVEAAAIFRLEPAWPGQWVWAAQDTVEYRLGKPLPAGRVFLLSATGELRARTGRRLEGKRKFRFQTSPLKLVACNVEAVDRTHVTLQLSFNQPVDPGELLRRVRVIDAKGAADLGEPVCLTKKPDEKLLLRASRPASNRLKVILDGRLAGHQAELPLGSQVVHALRVSQAFCLLRAEAPAPRLEETISLRLRFSRPLSGEQDLPKIGVTPAVANVRVHRSGLDLVLAGRFEPGRSYKLTVPGTLLAADGKTLGEETPVTVAVPRRKPGIAIPQRRGILSPRGAMMLDAKVVNVSGLRLRAWRVHENNLVAHLRRAGPDVTSRSVLDETIKLALPRDEPRDVALDLRELLQQGSGIYRIAVRATRPTWLSTTALVTVTDLAITAKYGRTGLFVWATSLRTGRPVADAEVRALTYTNQVLAAAKTDAKGIARLAIPANHPDGPAWVITAEKDGDQSYLQPRDSQWVIDDVDQSGRPRARTYEAMLYTERGVYRPGDVVHVTGILRDHAGEIPPSFPLAVKVTRPDGRQVAELTARPEQNAQGVFHVGFPTRGDGQTGPYGVEVTLPGAEETLGWTEALVEAFVPLRMAVTAEPTAERFGPDDVPKLAVRGRYLWDQPAASLPVRVEGTLRRVRYRSKRHAAFRFGAPARSSSITLATVTGRLDARGRAELAVKPPESLAAGLYSVRLSATVSEEGGRSVSSSTTAVLDKLDRHVGLRLPAGQVVPVGEKVSLDWVRVTGGDEPAAGGELALRLERVEYDTVLKRVNDRRVWQSVERAKEVETRELAAAAASGSLDVTCDVPGRYRLTLRDDRSGAAARLTFYASEQAAGTQSLAMNQPERLEIVLDKEKYLPGETAKVLVRSPIPGTLLLTLETDRVAASRVAQVKHNTAELLVPLPEGLRGGAFVTGTVVRAVDPKRESWLPHRALGMARLRLDHTAQRVPVAIDAPRQARPGQPVAVTVHAGPPSRLGRPTFVHLWAVDEGILLTSSYRTPDPRSFFLSPRRPGVGTADVFLRLLPDYARPAGMARIGAGGPGGPLCLDALRRNPVPTRQREAAVVWRAAGRADETGCLTVEMKLPELIGEMRLMAVAVDHDRYGHAEHALTLTQPLIAEATWPRFAAPGDEFDVPVKLFNATADSLAVRVACEAAGPLEIARDAALGRVIVPAGLPVTRFLKCKATGMGPVEVRVRAEALEGADEDLSAVSTASFPVRPAAALHCLVDLKRIGAGETLRLPEPPSLLPGTARRTIQVSPKPAVQLGPALEELIDYPYGCVEQTSSQLFSLLYAGDILGPQRAPLIREMVRAGIARLWSMQTNSGGLSYWPGGTSSYRWGTAYAASCLLEARAAGHKVDPRFARELAKYLAGRLDPGDGHALDHNTKALICRVLATFGDPPHGRMAQLAEQKDKLDLAGRAHLAGAFWAAGRKDRARDVLPKQAPGLSVPTTTGGRITSQVRQEAVLLSVLLEIDQDNTMIAPLAARLDKARRNGRWGSTLENAAAIAALSRYQAISDREEPEFTGSIRLGDGEPIRFDHTKGVSHRFEGTAGPVEIISAGKGTIYVAAASEGLAKKGVVEPYHRQLTVERRWLDRAGKPVDPQQLRVGDLVHVRITVRSPREVCNVAIVDALPAGLEVENPRLASSAALGPNPLFATDTASHVEFLDDRVVLFCRSRREKQVFGYALRATTAGRFDLPPVQASCMYDPAIASLGRGGRVKVAK